MLSAHSRSCALPACPLADVFSWISPSSLSLGSVLQPSPERVEVSLSTLHLIEPPPPRCSLLTPSHCHCVLTLHQALFWILTNLQHTISSLHFSTYHAVFSFYLRPALQSMSTAQSAYLRLLASTDPSDIPAHRTVELRAELDRRMEACWDAFTHARSKVYGYSRHAPAADAEVADPRRKGPGDDELVETSEDGGHSGGAPLLYHTSREVFTRSCFLFYIGRFHLSLKVITDHLTASPLSPAAASASSTTASSHYGRKLHAIRTSITHSILHPSSCSLFGLHPLSDLRFLLGTMRGWLLRPRLDVRWLKNSVKMALIICLASLISTIPPLVTGSPLLPDAVWAAFTAAILVSDSEGGLWQRGIHRLVGTVVGGLVGYIILLAFPSNWYPYSALTTPLTACRARLL